MMNLRKIISLGILSFSLSAFSAEFVVMNQIVTFDNTSNGFFFEYNTDRGPSNWVSPDNYRDGQFYFRYEIVSQPGDKTNYISFDIWGDWNSTAHTYSESAAPISDALNGPGSVSTFQSTPSSWFPHPVNGPVNFNSRGSFWRWGVVHWFSKSPNYVLAPLHYSNDPESWAAWATNSLWLPLQVKVTIVAVSQGSTFSGWGNYLGTENRQPTPTYGIDYAAEQTNKTVPSTDEYSNNSDMSGAVSGAGQKLSLTPGHDLYFRTKADGATLASYIQSLDVPGNPSAPTFTYDATNHRTSSTVSSAYEYSGSSDMSGAVTGNDTYVSFAEGTTKYFRKKATGSAFKSNIQSLYGTSTPPPTGDPEFVILNETIDYPNNTDNNGFYFFNYNSSMPANWLSPYDFYNGQVYTRYEIISQASNTPVALQFGIWQILPPPSGTLYETMAEQRVLNGPGSVAVNNSSPKDWWKLEGGVDYTKMDQVWHFGINPWKTNPMQQIRQENASVWDSRFINWYPMKVKVTVVAVAAGHTFSGWDNYITPVPTKQPTPTYGIDYPGERTNKAVPSSDEYSYSSDMSGAVSGAGQLLSITPGQDVYFRTKAGGSFIASDIQHLTVPARPSAPSYAIDYANELTVENVNSNVEYSTSSSYSSSIAGTGARVVLTPGQDLYFRVKSGASSFASGNFALVVPNRPATPAVTIDYSNEVTSAIAGSMDYSLNASLSPGTAGANQPVPVTPGTNLYIRERATSSQFNSNIQILEVPVRPNNPSFGYSFSEEQTSTVIPDSYEYADNLEMASATTGTGVAVPITPGSPVYFRLKATSSHFASGVQELIIPGRPVISSAVGDLFSDDFFTATIDFNADSTGFDAEDIEATNATVTLTEPLIIKVEPIATGEITVRVKANAILAGNFASDLLTTYYEEIISSIPESSALKGSILMYPAPVVTLLTVVASNTFILPAEITLMDDHGAVILQEKMVSDKITIDMNGIPSGIYIVKAIDSNGNVATGKIVKQ